MTKPYLVLYLNGVLAYRKATRHGALKLISQLASKGVQAVLAYECITGERQIFVGGN